MELPHGSIRWMELSTREPNNPLNGPVDCDVCIVGGGFTGLWTAYHLTAAEPGLRIVVLESETVGSGASGRNAGFAMTLLDMSLDHLCRNHGYEAARLAHEAVSASVYEIGETVAREGIDCEWKHGGLMYVATNKGQLSRLRRDLDAAERLGLRGFRALDADGARSLVDSPTYLGGLFEEACAVLNPAKLVHGLARVLEGRGVLVYEHSPVYDIRLAGSRMRVSTGVGVVTSEKVVLATNAWAAGTPWFRRKVTPLYTYIVLTEPLSDEQWESVGWDSHCGVEDKRNYVHYYRRTVDGRILWGGGDGVVYWRGRMSSSLNRHRRIAEDLIASFRQTFPQLRDVRFTHHWGGPVGITVRFVPLFGSLVGGRLHYGLGYNGHGVAPSHLGGKILRDLVLGADSPYTKLFFVDSKEPEFPPEPLRWIGAELTRRALLRQDRAFDRGSGDGPMDPMLLRVLRRLS
ncbi:MAG: hypothetical protein KatS3mg008_1813 [Acidimicrobiales bacterium]|nr:MAG: hypothetical protein KatS3mg008_1813 [Acidimicrobiales bacterium]